MIYIKNINVAEIFNIKNFVYYTRALILTILTISAIGLFIITNLYDRVLSDYEKRLDSIALTEGVDLTLMCNIVGCQQLITTHNGKERYFYNLNGVLKELRNKPNIEHSFFFPKITTDNFSMVKSADTIFFIDDKKYFTLVSTMMVGVYFIIILLFTITALFKAYYKAEADSIEKSNFRSTLSSRLQRDLTESLHHEMGMPLALIATLVREFFALVYPCKHTKDNVCDFRNDDVDIKLCEDCEFYKRRRATDAVAVDYYTKIMFAVDRINSVLRNIAAAKHIKYSNGTVSILSMMENIVAGFNNYKVNKISAIYTNKELLLKYAVSGGLNNGDMLNILGMLVKNAIEAKACEITFTGEQVVPGKLNIYIKDNGRGIRDAMDRIVKDPMIFQYGFSTKDTNGNHITAKSLLERFLLSTGVNIVNNGTPRGVGLSVNKGILSKCNGDIVIHETSSSGTTFKITLPIKERRDATS